MAEYIFIIVGIEMKSDRYMRCPSLHCRNHCIETMILTLGWIVPAVEYSYRKLCRNRQPVFGALKFVVNKISDRLGVS